MKNFLFLTSIACFLLLFFILAYKFPAVPRKLLGLAPLPEEIANPAAQYCFEQKGQRLAGQDEAGNFYILCRLPDGRLCDEWGLYQGFCNRP